MQTPRRTFSILALATGLLMAGGCGGSEADDSEAGDTTVASSSGESIATVSSAPVATDAAPITDAAPADPWSDTAADELGAALAAADGSGDVVDVMGRLFGNPIDAPLPVDAALTIATVKAERVDDTWEIDWQFAVASALSAADLEVALADGFQDVRFEVGARVVSTLDSGVFVTQNYPATDAADADGWATLAITVGPETDFGTATGRNQVSISAERTIPIGAVADDPSLTRFMQGWLDEMPVADGLKLVMVSASLVGLSTTGVWLDAEYVPTDGGPTFDELVEFYVQDFVEGALSIESSSMPTDLSTTDRFNAGFFPTLAGYTLFVNVERDFAEPSEPPVVLFNVRMEA